MKRIPDNRSVSEVLEALAEASPSAPFLALGQTVFWDEPVKVGIACASRESGSERRFVAAVHDTDYFAKAPGTRSHRGHFSALPHNDTTTKGLWSAAGEFSALFGGETVITKEDLQRAGLRVHALLREDAKSLDAATEAWGWRGIASLEDHPPIALDMSLEQVWPDLLATFQWAIDQTLECMSGKDRAAATILADQLVAGLCKFLDSGSLASFYRRLLPVFYSLAMGCNAPIEDNQTSELLRFNTSTCNLPRFELLDLFVNPVTRAGAANAYNQAISGSGLYDTSRFGVGAIPFDLVVPGHGRGTLRLGTHGIVIQTPTPLFLTLPRGLKISGLHDLASLVEAKFGSDCAVVGKAVTLVGMLAKEFVFVFHEGASSYVKYSRAFHRLLGQAFGFTGLNPVLRIRYDVWSSLKAVNLNLRLPTPFQEPFGATEIPAEAFADRWINVGRDQSDLLNRLAAVRRPFEWLGWLSEFKGGDWSDSMRRYDEINESLAGLRQSIEAMRSERRELLATLRDLRKERQELEHAKGKHFRDRIFEKAATDDDRHERDRFIQRIASVSKEIGRMELKLRTSIRNQRDIVAAPEIRSRQEERKRIVMSAEKARLTLIRNAIISSRGLANSNLRPSAWWLYLLSSDGAWFRQIWDSAECYLEPLA